MNRTNLKVRHIVDDIPTKEEFQEVRESKADPAPAGNTGTQDDFNNRCSGYREQPCINYSGRNLCKL